ncbi:hypothetical protein HFO88_25235 [Rhizobium leguminosarum]|uniref:hypothetical protein n=1 Tax=Rhizobium leguminosarum TaxID=384 RepID=UPI001440E9C6|nr:hypothetical protein [Rhizobium leguminosarum]MBY5903630.1 hypothetical protein [Rhizobium leguminosarum]MBY5910673.1 hypothetical protein [Rhizobium leguminosarum]MDV4161931.1 hypothetical protein [Rhizobium leguminosarum]MDV4172310.1 hypothetical protein [Rhizobium leguminosarum]NKK94833.1 hypothetical protein [Rhizobium leguminosarum bv. viciae]
MMMAISGDGCILKNSGFFKKNPPQHDVYNRCFGFATQVPRRHSSLSRLFELGIISAICFQYDVLQKKSGDQRCMGKVQTVAMATAALVRTSKRLAILARIKIRPLRKTFGPLQAASD